MMIKMIKNDDKMIKNENKNAKCYSNIHEDSPKCQ